MSSTSRAAAAAAAIPIARGEPAKSRTRRVVDWSRLIQDVLHDPTLMQLVFQPIVGLADAQIVGYEALARFEAEPGLTPDRWFAAADRLGYGVELESLVVTRCLDLRSSVPGNCFLTLNVSPHLLVKPRFADVLRSAGNLAPLILELTEHQAVKDVRPLIKLRNELTAQGAFIALDDTGSGYSGLQQMSVLRPHMIKLDRSLVANADQDEVKLALAELLGQFAGRLDAWLLAEGVETWGEMDAFMRIQVPLAQGYLLGRPAPAWAVLDPRVRARLLLHSARSQLVENVASLLEQAAVHGDADPAGGIAVHLTHDQRPEHFLLPEEGPKGLTYRTAPISLRVSASATVDEVALRLLSRPSAQRFDPITCVDGEGKYVGVIRVERILSRLVELHRRER